MDQVLVVGAGAIGLLSAYQLARAGLIVKVLEAGEAGRESSWAGGGIVSPLYPWRYQAPVTALAHWSQDFYPHVGQQLFAQTGIDPQVYETGLFWLDLEDQAQALAWAQKHRRPLRELAMEEVRRQVPALGPTFKRAIYLEGVANVRNPRLVKALRAALMMMSNVELIEHCQVQGFVRDGRRVTGVTTTQGVYRAPRIAVAAGAWSGGLLATLGIEIPVVPVKGQMLLYRADPSWLTRMVLAEGRYAIPRRDGHILVGSTLEHAEFDKTPTAQALDSLQCSAQRLLPELARASPVRHWAGLRPGSPDGVPFIGELEQAPGLWLNCGHYRNGLVLAPASCELLKNLMLGEAPIIDPAPYAPSPRLASSASRSPAF